MVLETLSSSRINIGTLILEGSLAKSIPFDPYRDIKERDWEEMKTALKIVSEYPNFWSHQLRLMAAMKTIFPERSDDLQPYLDNIWLVVEDRLGTAREVIRTVGVQKYDITRDNPPVEFVMRTTIRLKRLFPERVDRLILKQDWPNLQTFFELTKTNSNYRPHLLVTAFYLRVIFPDEISRYNLNENDWQRIMLSANVAKKINKWALFAEGAARIRILSEKKFHELKIDGSTWKNLRRIYSQGKDEMERPFLERNNIIDWDDYVDMAANLKILAAQEVRFTDQGLDISMPLPQKSFQQSISALPTVRRF